MAEAKRKPAAKQVMDVNKPDKVAADATAKPVIVTNRQILRDPMVMSEATTPVPEPKAEINSKEIVLEPEAITELETKADEKPAAVEAPAETPAEVPAKDKQEPESEVEEEKPDPETTQGPAEPVPTEVTTQAAIEAAAEDAKAKREAEIQKLIDKKQYFLPINAMEQRRAAQFMTFGIVLSIFLALAWLDVALDAGLIHIDNVHALTHFFSN